MNHAELRTDIARRIDLLLSGGVELPYPPRPYQLETLRKLQSWLQTEQEHRCHIVYATGLGKTFVFSILIAACTGLRTIIVVPTNVLLEQTVQKITEVTKGVVGILTTAPTIMTEDGHVIGIKTMTGVDILVTTDESFVSKKHRIINEFQPQIIMYDECHWAYRHPALKVLDILPEAIVIGFTATPDYLTNVRMPSYAEVLMEDGAVLYGSPKRFAATYFGQKIHDIPISWGINEGYLAPLAWGEIDLEETSLENVPVAEGEGGLDYKREALDQRLADTWEQTCQAVVRLYQKGTYDLANRHTFSICSTVAAAERLAEVMTEAGYRAVCVSGHTPAAERRKILAAFRNGEIQFISSVMVLREGWDSPNADVCLMLRPTKSRLLYMQTIGRVLRIAADDSYKIALIIDAHYQGAMFAPLSAPIVFGQPGQKIKKGGMLIGHESDTTPQPGDETMTVPKPRIERVLQGLPDGSVIVQGERYELLVVYGARNGFSEKALRAMIGAKNVRRVRALLVGKRNFRNFYHPDDLDDVVFRANKKGESLVEIGFGRFIERGEPWWTLRTFMKEYNIKDEEIVTARMKHADIRSIIRLANSGRIPCHFYSIADLRETFRDIIPGAV